MKNQTSENLSYTHHNHHEVGMGGPMFCDVILSDGAVILDAAFSCVDIYLKQDESHVCILCMSTYGYFYIKIYDKRNNTLEELHLDQSNSEVNAFDFFESNNAFQIANSNHEKESKNTLYPFRDLKFPNKIDSPAEYLFKTIATGEVLKAQLGIPTHLKSQKNPFDLVYYPYYIWEHKGVKHFVEEEAFLKIQDFQNGEILVVDSQTVVDNFSKHGAPTRVLLDDRDYVIGDYLYSKDELYWYEITNITFDYFEIKIEPDGNNPLPNTFSFRVSWQENDIIVETKKQNKTRILFPLKI